MNQRNKPNSITSGAGAGAGAAESAKAAPTNAGANMAWQKKNLLLSIAS